MSQNVNADEQVVATVILVIYVTDEMCFGSVSGQNISRKGIDRGFWWLVNLVSC